MSEVAAQQPPANVQEAVRALERNQSYEDELVLDLGDLDLTSEQISLAGLEKDVDALAQHEVLKSSLDQDLDPREYGKRYDDELRQAELASVEDYIAEAGNLTALHRDIKQCDQVLQEVESVLARFQSDLGSISSEIRLLQSESQSLNGKLRTKRALRDELEEFVRKISLDPGLIRGIIQAEAQSEEFLSLLGMLGSKLDAAASDPDVQSTTALRDVTPELERLRIKAITKSRDFLFGKFWDFRRPRTNIQIKQPVLLKYKPMVVFLKRHAPDIYGEVQNAYVDVVSTKILDLFRNYWAIIDRLEEKILTEHDTLGLPPAAPGVGMLSFFHRTSGGDAASGAGVRAEAFDLQDRAFVLEQVEAPPLVLHAAESRGERFPYETLFRSMGKLLADTAAHEYLFCDEFWGEPGVYIRVFGPVLAFVEASLSAALAEQHDPLALLLMACLNRRFALAMARRRNPALDEHFDAVNLLIWPRLKQVMDVQLASVKALSPGHHDTGGGGFGGAGGGVLSNTRTLLGGIAGAAGGTTAAAAAPGPPGLHYLTERYAALMPALLVLQAGLAEEPLENNMERLRYAVMNALLSLSHAYPGKRAGAVFLVMNFGHIAAALRSAVARGLPRAGSGAGLSGAEAGPGPDSYTSPTHGQDGAWAGGTGPDAVTATLGPSGTAVLHEMEEGLRRATSIYVEDVLSTVAPDMLSFVKRAEVLAAGQADGQALPGAGPSDAEPIVHDFSATWHSRAEAMAREVSRDFGATNAAKSVLQAVFTQLLMHYSRLLELLKRQGPAGVALTREAVSLPNVMYGLNALSR